MMSEPPTPPCNLPYWIAHTPSKQNPRFHGLRKHILSVSELARDFAIPLQADNIAYWLGLLHDLGKFRDEFQVYLHCCYEASKDPKNKKAPRPGSAPHKQAGALAARQMLGLEWGCLLALPLFGHHGGMRSAAETPRLVLEKTDEAEVAMLLERAASVDERLRPVLPDLSPLQAFAGDGDGLEMYLRLIYSCLVDADALDTESHNDPDAAQRRAQAVPPSVYDLRDQLLTRQEEDFAGKKGTVNAIRREVYDACLLAANSKPGFFTLTVPTGGGKTRSSLAFALCHAAKHDLRRVVYAIPYTSIVDQTAGTFRDLFGNTAGTVLEHHSAIDLRRTGRAADSEEDEEQANQQERWRKLAAQNWDAPLIATTTVQLFESLFSNRPSACRKLHRLAGSIIVLDEAQCLPPHLLDPIRSGLQTLVEHFGATVVFCTATQPAHDVEAPHLRGIVARPIIAPEQQQQHFAALKRVRYFVKQEEWNWARVAEEMQQDENSCLCIVNTRRQALDLLDKLDPEGTNPDVLHLSTLLCGQHRRDALVDIRKRLIDGPRVLLVSTQVIEAGVDVDFPRALRAIGPLDRIVQAAGRCNREGNRLREDSHVIIFTPEDGGMPRGFYRMAQGRTVNLLKGHEEIELDDPVFVTEYFRNLYADLALDPNAVGKAVQDDRIHFRYDDVAQKVRLIEQDTVGVFITTYCPEEAQAIIKAAQSIGRMTRELWQRAQPFCVALPFYEAEARKHHIDESTVPGLKIWLGAYHSKQGIPFSNGTEDLLLAPGKNIV